MTDIEDGDEPRVSFSDGSGSSYDLVVGADGVHSTIRRLALGGPPAQYVGQAGGSSPTVSLTSPIGRSFSGRGRTFLTVALGHGVVYCYADVNTSEPASAADKEWRQSFADFAEPVPRLLDQATEAYFAPIEEVVPPALGCTASCSSATPPTSSQHGPGRGDGGRGRSRARRVADADQPVEQALGRLRAAAPGPGGLVQSRPIAATARSLPRLSGTSPCGWPQSASSNPATRRCETHRSFDLEPRQSAAWVCVCARRTHSVPEPAAPGWVRDLDLGRGRERALETGK